MLLSPERLNQECILPLAGGFVNARRDVAPKQNRRQEGPAGDVNRVSGMCSSKRRLRDWTGIVHLLYQGWYTRCTTVGKHVTQGSTPGGLP